MATDTFFGHPRGLATLFFTEMWERFTFYGMRSLLVLFMTASVTGANPGLELTEGQANAIYGLYLSCVYLFALPGGWIADRLTGQRTAVIAGGVLIALGNFMLALGDRTVFFLGLVVIVLGVGLLKPNISAMVGRLYDGLPSGQRDAGFSIFYMGINLGAFIAPLVCGYLGQEISWHYGFGAAGIGMTLGVIQYVLGTKNLGDAGLAPAPATPEERARWKRQAQVSVAILLGLVVVIGGGGYTGLIPVTATQVADAAGVMLLLLIVGFFGWLYTSSDWTPEERKRLYVIGVLFVAASIFWSLFEQAGSTLNLFARDRTDNSVLGAEFPSSWFQSMNSMFLIIFAPVMAWVWIRLSATGKEPSTPMKFAWGLIFAGLGFAILVLPAQNESQLASPMWLTTTYFLHTIGELFLSPVGLSAMTVLAPARIGGLMMGVWFLATSVGNFISGRVSGLYEAMALPSLFGTVAAIGIVLGVILILMTPAMRSLLPAQPRK